MQASNGHSTRRGGLPRLGHWFDVSDLCALQMRDLIIVGEFLEYIASILHPYLLSYSAEL
jgi:hypothetical protein